MNFTLIYSQELKDKLELYVNLIYQLCVLQYQWMAKKLGMAAPLCLMCETWKERNRVVFESVEFSVSRIESFFLSPLVFWARSMDVGGKLGCLFVLARLSLVFSLYTWVGFGSPYFVITYFSLLLSHEK